MPRKKKSRKIGQIGVRKSDQPRQPKRSEVSPRTKKSKGNPAGSRHSSGTEHSAGVPHVHKDKRVGSKKPIPLVVEAKKPAAKPKKAFYSPKEELADIENDKKLERLLERLDNEHTLTTDEQRYVDERTSRFQTLCEMLGIEMDDEPESEDVDPIESLDAISLDDYMDDK